MSASVGRGLLERDGWGGGSGEGAGVGGADGETTPSSSTDDFFRDILLNKIGFRFS